MTTNAVEFHQLCIVANGRYAIRELTLLHQREEDVCPDADHQHTIQLQSFEASFQRAAVLCEIKQVRGA